MNQGDAQSLDFLAMRRSDSFVLRQKKIERKSLQFQANF
jgi:hypothetical protein